MTGPLVAAADLAAAIASAEPPVVLDVRWRLTGPPAIDDYRAGHLPGAVFVSLDDDLAGPPGEGGRHPLPDATSFEAAMRRYGVSDGRPVVVYDEADATAASRAWWLLRYFGHSSVAVLDGGFRGWVAAGLPVTADVPAPSPGDFVARPGGLPVLSASEAAVVARDGVLLDARAVERYRGEVEPIDPVAGHVPGAVSAPTSGNVSSSGHLLPADSLRARFAALGVGAGAPVGAYCGSGVTAAQVVLALEVAGYAGALYAGSWSEWIRDPARPVETGSPAPRGA